MRSNNIVQIEEQQYRALTNHGLQMRFLPGENIRREVEVLHLLQNNEAKKWLYVLVRVAC